MKTSLQHISSVLRTGVLPAALLWAATARAQVQPADSVEATVADSAIVIGNGPGKETHKAENVEGTLLFTPATEIKTKSKRDWNTWRPDAKRAMWLAIVIPGGGQIYNRKYWKLPIVYGGFIGCYYALRWNNQMYHDYSQAYMDLVDNDPTSKSYTQFLHLGNTIDNTNIERYTELFRKRKDRYRRWRDLSIFSMIGVYALSVIDAYVDASLSEFDISDDLSLRVEPAVMGGSTATAPSKWGAIGVQCSLNF